MTPGHVFSVYGGPDGEFSLFRWGVGRGDGREKKPLASGNTLADVRRSLPPGLLRVDRTPADDADCVEHWL